MKKLYIVCVVAFLSCAGAIGEVRFNSPDGVYSVFEKAEEDGSKEVVVGKIKGDAFEQIIGNDITNISLFVQWSPDSSMFLLDMWFGTKGRSFVIYEKRNGKFVRLPILQGRVDFSDFDRKYDFLKIKEWGDDSKSFILMEEVGGKVRHYKCSVRQDRVDVVLK
jgi:hypothetical protein